MVKKVHGTMNNKERLQKLSDVLKRTVENVHVHASITKEQVYFMTITKILNVKIFFQIAKMHSKISNYSKLKMF